MTTCSDHRSPREIEDDLEPFPGYRDLPLVSGESSEREGASAPPSTIPKGERSESKTSESDR